MSPILEQFPNPAHGADFFSTMFHRTGEARWETWACYCGKTYTSRSYNTRVIVRANFKRHLKNNGAGSVLALVTNS